MREIRAPIAGTMLKLLAAEGDSVREGDVVAVIESMKLEIAVEAGVSGTVASCSTREGEPVEDGQVLFVVE